MCWTTNKKAVCETAKEKIEIIKVCYNMDNKTLISCYWEFEYELNKIYSAEEELKCLSSGNKLYNEVHAGFHSYTPNCTIVKDSIVAIWNDNIFLDSYDTDVVVVKGYIPTGAHYYLNERGEYVSNKICLTSIEEL